MKAQPKRTPWYRILYVQVILGVLLGIMIGWLWPEWGKSLKPLGDGFIKCIKMLIAPVIFCTVVHGIASVGDLKKLGRVGGKTLIYFEVISTIALIIGLVVVNVLEPGVGFHVKTQDLAGAELATAQKYAAQGHSLSTVDFFLNMIPTSFLGAFTSGDLLQVLVVSLLTAFALTSLGERGHGMLAGIERVGEVFFAIMGLVVKLAPIGAFGAMAYAVGGHGLGALVRLLYLMLGFYITSGLFIVFILGGICRWCGFSIFRLLRYLREELLLVLGTSSSETALPSLIQKLRGLGCAPSTVGLVIPTGYSFNLDGTNIYMAMAAVFLAQATDTPLSLMQQISLLIVAMITSKGASGVTGAGLITLAATLAAFPSIPAESLALLVGIDRFMSECRSLTNLIGNSVATVVISRWEGEVSAETLAANLEPIHTPPPSAI